MHRLYDPIKTAINEGRIEEALHMAEAALHTAPDASLYYLCGNAYAKTGRRREAMNAYLKAEAIDPDSPAAEARQLLERIQNFYHRDLYNP
jgi:Flp pilus assembly protein TadD